MFKMCRRILCSVQKYQGVLQVRATTRSHWLVGSLGSGASCSPLQKSGERLVTTRFHSVFCIWSMGGKKSSFYISAKVQFTDCTSSLNECNSARSCRVFFLSFIPVLYWRQTMNGDHGFGFNWCVLKDRSECRSLQADYKQLFF